MLGLFKKKESPKQPVKEESANERLARFNEERGDWYNAFYFRHKEEIDSWDALITASRQAGKNPDSIVQLSHARESLSLLDRFHEWCLQFDKGDEFFKMHCANGERSLYNRVTSEINSLEKKLKK